MRHLTLLLLAALAACSKPAPAPEALQTAAAPAIPADAPVILAFGDSLYAGYRLAPGEGYPPRLEAALNAAGVKARVVNAGVSGDTTAAALDRLAFTLDGQKVKPALVLVGLGGNDMLRGLPPEQTRANLDAILTELDKRHIPALLTGMLAAPNMGKDYVAAFNPIYPALAAKHKAALVPFFLQAVIGNDKLMLDDHIHPNAAGVDKIVAATKDQVTKALKAATAR
ncbi:MAG: arylesterase [Novosphingobium sp.]|uniref:arylesterase n=1 Tax=Novosphingobium sp. TaxID=1874826 RepID=UPI0030178F97